MRHTIYVIYKYPSFVDSGYLYRGSYSARTIVGAYLKALWATRFEWQYYIYRLE